MSVICMKCFGGNVTCEAVINPNSKEVDYYVDQNKYGHIYGYCNDCFEPRNLIDTNQILEDINQEYQSYKLRNNKEPEYANCDIRYKAKHGEENIVYNSMLIKLSTELDESTDEFVFHYCRDLDDFRGLVEPSCQEFIIYNLIEFI